MPCRRCLRLEQPDDLIIIDAPTWRVLLDPDQLYLGRALVIAQRHVSDMSQLNREERFRLEAIRTHYERIIRQRFGAVDYDWTYAPGTDPPGSPSLHVALQVRPRYETAPSTLGESWPDPNFGRPYYRSRARRPGRQQLCHIAHGLLYSH